MGLLDIFKRKPKEDRGILPTNYSGDLSGIDTLSLFTYTSNTGATINEKTALEVTAISAAIRVIAESIASLPFCVYQRTKTGDKNRATQHPLYSILHDAPNPYMTSFVFWETVVSHMMLWGNAYAEIEWGPDGQIKALWLLRPDLTRPIVDDKGNLYFETVIGGQVIQLPYYRVLHIYGLGFDGLMGYSPIRLYREAIGLSKATEKYGATYFGNGARPGGVLEHPGNLSEPAQNNLRTSWNQMHSGLDNAHRIAILEEGMTYKQIGLPPEDSQFLETRKFQIAEISRIFRVPLHMLSELDRSTNNNIEHQSIEFLTHTLTPWLVRIEQACGLKLLTPNERKKFYCEHIVDNLLRGDIKTRYESYQIARQNGWLSANDIRKMENMNPIADEEGGNAYMVNTAMQPISNLLNANNLEPPKGGDNANGQGQQTNIDAQQSGDSGGSTG
jgi:HK97 family phage portal protein